MTYGIVIASYKYGHLAAHAIETVLAQTKKFNKVWFVDDGVGDCKHLPEIYPEVEYVLRKENLGTIDNFQDMLMNHVDTDYVMFMGADNWLRQDALELLADEVADVVISDIHVVGEQKDGILVSHRDQVEPFEGGYYWTREGEHHGSMLYDVELVKKLGGYTAPKQKRTLEDLDLFMRLVDSGAHISWLPDGLLYYRRHRENYNPCT